MLCVNWMNRADSLCCRRARFKRSNSVTASVQADLDPEGFPGLGVTVPTQDKSLQFGCSFQRHSSEPESATTPCMRDGEFFLRLLQTEVERMEGWCQNMEREAEENELPEEILELIRNAVGSAQMLMSQKVQQFFRLCQQSVVSYPQPTSQDLAGFWDLLQLNIEDVRVKFQDLQRLKDSGWRLPTEKKVRVLLCLDQWFLIIFCHPPIPPPEPP
uniref:Discs, large (Drosophila) homolog-associated protein 3 n=1 Tax=Cynoglossus semilaevis TaxID=244447 RepID=A0A3P8W4D6_CYNSE